MAKKGKKALGIGCGVLVVAAVIVAFTEPGRAVGDLWSRGIIQDAVFKPEKKAEFTADRAESLKAIHTALMLYHDSEGAFPPADRWMDAIEPRLRSNELTAEAARQKLVRPDLRGQTDAFGYALNAKAAGQYKDDVGPGTTPLIFESKGTGKNLTGDPAKDALEGGGQIAIDGTGG